MAAVAHRMLDHAAPHRHAASIIAITEAWGLMGVGLPLGIRAQKSHGRQGQEPAFDLFA